MKLKYKTHIIVPSSPKAYIYIEWLIENEITEYDYRPLRHFSNYRLIVYYVFWFINLEDAMAFKLRWL